MTRKDIGQLIKYWENTASHDYKTMLSLFKTKRYSDSLFYGHLVLEKILKALVVKRTGSHPKPIHNLLVLFTDASISLENNEVAFLAEVNKFNIKARYPDYKLSFYKLCTLNYVSQRLEGIKLLYRKLCHILKAQK